MEMFIAGLVVGAAAMAALCWWFKCKRTDVATPKSGGGPGSED